MSRRSSRPPLVLESDVREYLAARAASRTAPAREVERASILLGFANGTAIADIARQYAVSRDLVERCLDRAAAVGPQAALKDRKGRGRERVLTPEARTWIVELACVKPKDIGYAQELWTTDLLSRHARIHGPPAGHPSLGRLGRGTVSKILAANVVQPHRIEYYLERRDPEFEEKRATVLAVYQEVELLRKAVESGTSPLGSDGETPVTAVLSFDEKPGIQALDNLAADLPPVPGKHASIGRDHEYRRHGTLSLLAAIDLVTGLAHGIVRERHRSREFIELLDSLDTHYAPGLRIRVVLDNHSAHTSKETYAWLATKPGRFEFVFTPKHGSWLNLVEGFFAKMAKTMLRGIRVRSKAELKRRIELWLEEVNEQPVVFRWKYGLEALAMGAST